MLKIIKRSEIEVMVEYRRFFEWKLMPGAGFSFDSDEHGNVDVEALNPTAQGSYRQCMEDENLEDRGVQKYSWTYRHPTIGLCACGAEIELHAFTNTCDNCEREYNMSGQELAPRSQWGEETGESLADILGPGDPFD